MTEPQKVVADALEHSTDRRVRTAYGMPGSIITSGTPTALAEVACAALAPWLRIAGDDEGRYCEGCGGTIPLREITDDWHVRVDHDPSCMGGKSCGRTCPVQVQCGPVGRAEAEVARLRAVLTEIEVAEPAEHNTAALAAMARRLQGIARRALSQVATETREDE